MDFLEGEAEEVREVGEEAVGELIEVEGVVEVVLEAGERGVGHAAGDEEREGGDVVGEVDGGAVGGDAPGDAHANAGDFAGRSVEGPEAGVFLVVVGEDAVGLEGLCEAGGHAADEVDDAEVGAFEVEDGVEHELTGAVEGGFAAPVDPEELGALVFELLESEEVVEFATFAEGNDGGMLEADQVADVRVVGYLLQELVAKSELQGQGLAVRQKSWS